VFTEAGAWHTRQITEGVNHTNTGHISTAKIGLRVAECEKKKVSMRLSWKHSPASATQRETNMLTGLFLLGCLIVHAPESFPSLNLNSFEP